MINDSKQIGAFLLIDVISNTQSFVQEFDLDMLKEAVSRGQVLVVEYMDNTRDLVTPEEVIEWYENQTPVIANLVEQEIFVPLINSIAELIETSYTPAVALIAGTQKRSIDGKLENFKNLLGQMNDRYLPNIEGE